MRRRAPMPAYGAVTLGADVGVAFELGLVERGLARRPQFVHRPSGTTRLPVPSVGIREAQLLEPVHAPVRGRHARSPRLSRSERTPSMAARRSATNDGLVLGSLAVAGERLQPCHECAPITTASLTAATCAALSGSSIPKPTPMGSAVWRRTARASPRPRPGPPVAPGDPLERDVIDETPRHPANLGDARLGGGGGQKEHRGHAWLVRASTNSPASSGGKSTVSTPSTPTSRAWRANGS